MAHILSKWFLRLSGIIFGYFFIVGAVFSPAGFLPNGNYPTLPGLPGQHPDHFAPADFPSLKTLNPDDALLGIIHLQPWERANAVSLSDSADLLAVGSSFGVHLFALPGREEIRFIETGEWARSVALTGDGKSVAAGIFDHTIKLWNTTDGSLIRTLLGHTDRVTNITFNADDSMLASAADDDTIRIWRTDDGSLVRILDNDTEGVRCVTFSPDMAVIAAGMRDGTIRLWRVQDGVLLNTLKGHKDWVRTLQFSHDGKILASGAFDANARLWRVSDGTLLHALKGHRASVLGLAFTPDDSTLITGSVDTTIRLWRVDDGQLKNILTGHTGFIYDVAISADGGMLVSGADDASVRLWDLPQVLLSFDQPPPPASHSGDCQVCHHPLGNSIAPAVLEVRCETCHSGGASLNWCPVFPAQPNAPTSIVGHTLSAGNAGIPRPGKNIGIKIVSPGNGETFYTRPDLKAPLNVTGKVTYAGTDVSKITVHVEVWAGAEKLAAVPAVLNSDGYFSINLGINPDGNNPVESADQIDAGRIVCDSCHAQYAAEYFLPRGDVRLMARATTPDEATASDDRWINVDVSSAGVLNVTVVDDQTGEPVPGVAVQAVTRLYEWRARNFNAITGANGVGIVDVEVLSRASTAYAITVPDQIVNGTYYEGMQSEEISYQPGSAEAQGVVIRVQSRRGVIGGSISQQQGAYTDSVTVWALELPAGPIHQAQTIQGIFVFKNLPVARYLVSPDIGSLAGQGLVGNVESVDLAKSTQSKLMLTVAPVIGKFMTGNVSEQQAVWLPFAWLTLPNGSVHSVDTTSGTWLTPVDAADRYAVITAPGYFSQTIALQSGNNTELKRRPDTRTFPWGQGALFMPAETTAVFQDGVVRLDVGWLWGHGEEDKALLIRLPGAEIRWSSGRFALEKLPNQAARFYLLDGEAAVRSNRLDQSIGIQPGSMVVVQEDGRVSVLANNTAVSALLNPVTETLLSPVWEPGLYTMLQNSLAKFGLSTIQVVTFITYSLILIAIVGIPLITIYFVIMRRGRSAKRKYDDHG